MKKSILLSVLGGIFILLLFNDTQAQTGVVSSPNLNHKTVSYTFSGNSTILREHFNLNTSKKSITSEFEMFSLNDLLRSDVNTQYSETHRILSEIAGSSPEELMAKGKRKTTVGTVFAVAGGALIILGSVGLAKSLNPDPDDGVASNAATTFLGTALSSAVLGTGVLTGLVSIPFFTRGAHLKKEARLQLQTGTITTPGKINMTNNNSGNNTNYAGISISLNL